MPGPIHRTAVVKFFGQPHATEGSVNEPREREDYGLDAPRGTPGEHQ